MSRVLCQQCQRPEKACICAFTVNITNRVHVIVLQHPTEVKQSKGTVSLLQQSLSNCQVIVGENFHDNEQLTKLLSTYGKDIALLYPSEQATVVDFTAIDNNLDIVEPSDIDTIKCIIILDGTWKKAYRMFMLNAFLGDIKHLTLPTGITSLYGIRKTKKNDALSSLEACCHTLARLENDEKKYQALLKKFIAFNVFQQSFKKL